MVKILDFQFADPRWRRIPKLQAQLEQAAEITLAHLPNEFRFSCSASLFLTNDKQVRQLNRDFRGKDKATNVLSFPQFELAQLPKKGKQRGPVEMGDIVLAYQYIVDEAKKDHKLLLNHTIHLMIHGLLHLFGYDHHSDGDALKMERLEKKIMAELGLPDPYESVLVKAVKSKRGTTTSQTAHTKR